MFKTKQEEHKVVIYAFARQSMSMVTEDSVEYGKKD